MKETTKKKGISWMRVIDRIVSAILLAIFLTNAILPYVADYEMSKFSASLGYIFAAMWFVFMKVQHRIHRFLMRMAIDLTKETIKFAEEITESFDRKMNDREFLVKRINALPDFSTIKKERKEFKKSNQKPAKKTPKK